MGTALVMESPKNDAANHRFDTSLESDMFSELYRSHADTAYRVALRFLQNDADAEDAVHAAFLEILQNKARLPNQKDLNTKGWIVGIVANVCRNRLRSDERREARETLAGQPIASTPDDAAELKSTVVKAVDRLPSHYRLPIWLHYLEGMPFHDVAATLTISEGTVRKQAQRGLEIVRQSLGLAAGASLAVDLPSLLASVTLEKAPATLHATLRSLPQGVKALPKVSATGKSALAKLSIGIALATLSIVGIVAASKPPLAVTTPVPAVSKVPPKTPAGDAQESPRDPVVPPPVEAVANAPLNSGELSHSLGWRGDGTGVFPSAMPPTEWSRTKNATGYTTKNIKFVTPLPARSPSSPIVVGDRIFLTVDVAGLMCIDRRNGKIQWLHSFSWCDTIPAQERTANAEVVSKVLPLEENLARLDLEIQEELNKNVQDGTKPIERDGKELKERNNLEWKIAKEMKAIDATKYTWPYQQSAFGRAVYTPCSDGKRVYAWFDGIAVCCDLDGKPIWIFGRSTRDSIGEHGNAASPVLVDNRFIVQLTRTCIALDAASGKVLWEQPTHGCEASLLAAKIGNDTIVVAGGGANAFRVSDGKPAWKDPPFAGVASPIVAGNTIYGTNGAANGYDCAMQSAVMASTFADKAPRLESTLVKCKNSKAGVLASPVFSDGLYYAAGMNGYLAVFDASARDVVYEQQLDMNPTHAYVNEPGLAASLSIAGKYLFATDNTNTTVVLETGRSFKPVAKNVIENHELATYDKQVLGSCFFAGNEIFIHAFDSLYCVSNEKAH